MQIKKNLDKAFLFKEKYNSLCSNVLNELVEYFDFSDYFDSEEELKYFIAELSLDYNPSDGFIIIDCNANNYSIQSFLDIIEKKSKIKFEDFKNCSI